MAETTNATAGQATTEVAPKPTADAGTEVKTVETKATITADAGAKPPKDGEVQSVTKESNPENPDKPYVVKVDGKEYNLSKDEVIKLAQKGVGAEKRFQEAATIKQQFEEFFRLLKTDPMVILQNKNLGLDFKKLAQDYLKKEIDREMMSPQERELAELKDKLAAKEQEERQKVETEAQMRHQALVKHYNDQYEKDITETLKESGLPKTRSTVKRIAYYMHEGVKRGVDLSAKDVVDIVRKDYIRDFMELFGNLDGDRIIEVVGDDVIKKIREADLKRITSTGQQTKLEVVSPTQSSSQSADGKKMDKDEWRKMMDERYGKI